MILDGKRILVTGVLDRNSIAYAVAEHAQQQGAEIVLTGYGRGRRITERAATALPKPPDVLELDVTKPDDLSGLREELTSRWEGLDGAVHAIAFAPPDAMKDDFLNTPAESALKAFEVSAFSLKSLVQALAPLLEASGSGSVVGFHLDARQVWPSYDWMGVSKAALESVTQYLAHALGPRGVRVNLVAAGPMQTAAATQVRYFDELVAEWLKRAPLGWDTKDASPIASATAFLLSDMARAITGEVLHVDGGMHAIAAALAEKG
jgi:enoyl-[acyl-carrier protein] reductase I